MDDDEAPRLVGSQFFSDFDLTRDIPNKYEKLHETQFQPEPPPSAALESLCGKDDETSSLAAIGRQETEERSEARGCV